jgi:urea transporter
MGRSQSLQQILAITLLCLKTTLIGIAQIMLQQSIVVGIVFTAGAIFNSPILATFGLIGSAMGALTATVAKFDQQNIRNGLFGFNGALVGFGLGYYYGTQWPLVVFVLLGAASSTLISQWMCRRGIPPYTFPFVVTTWCIMALFLATGWFEIVPWSTNQTDGLQIVHGISRAFGQVLFQENLVTGFLLIAAVMFKSWVEGVYAIFASVLGMLLAVSMGLPLDAINLGFFGYNGVLCAIVLVGKASTDFFSAVGAIVLSVLFVWYAIIIGIPALTAPFVFATWVVLLARKIFDKKFKRI